MGIKVTHGQNLEILEFVIFKTQGNLGLRDGLVKYLLWKHEDMNLNPQNLYKIWVQKYVQLYLQH